MIRDDLNARPGSSLASPGRLTDADRLEALLEARREEMNETADEATDRCRAEAARDQQQRHFDATLAELLRVFDSTAADQQYSGMTLDEAGYFDHYMLDELVRNWRQMQFAFDAADREGYRRAAAKFTSRAVCFSAGIRQ